MAEFIIVFREVLEASLIIGILYTFLNKTNQQDAIKQLWKGVYLALIASVVGSVLFQKLLGGFAGQAEKLFEGIVMIVAAAVLGTMIIWMAKNKNIAAELEEQAELAISSEKMAYGIFGLAFISVFREGIETILFIYGIMIKQGGVSIAASLLGGLLAKSLNSSRVASLSLTLSLTICLIYPLLGNLNFFLDLVLLMLWGFFVISDSPQFSAISASACPKHLVGTALTTQNCVGFSISMITVFLTTHFYESLGLYFVWILLPGPIVGLIFFSRQFGFLRLKTS